MMRAVRDPDSSAGVAYLAPVALTGEQRHRRLLLLAICGLIVLSFTPIVGHHLAGGADALLAGVDHLGQLCLVALHLLLGPVHTAFHFLLAAGVAYATWDRARAWRAMRTALAPLDAACPAASGAFAVAARLAGLEVRRLRVVEGLPNPAFTAGWWRPTVYVARALAERLTPAELAAVLAHEAAHVRRRDPLRLSTLRFAAHALFWIPALRRLADDVADEAEVQADDAAATRDPIALAAALVAVAAWPAAGAPVRGAVGFVKRDLLDRRVRRLLGEETMPQTHVTRRSLLGAAAALALVWASSVAVVHPLPPRGAHHAAHCAHHAWAITHLFCRPDAVTSGECPHASRDRPTPATPAR